MRRAHELPEWVKELAIAGSVLGLVLLCVYGNVVFARRSVIYSDNFNPLALGPNVGPGLVPVEEWTQRNLLYTANFADPWVGLGQWEPQAEFLRKTLARGEWPLWNPYLAAGSPGMIDQLSSHFFPPYLLTILLGNTSLLRNVYALALVGAAGLFTYFFLRRHELRRDASLCGGIVYMLSGAVNQDVASVMGQAVSFLPMALWCTAFFLDRPSWRRAAGLSCVYAVVSLAGFPPRLVAALGLTACYALWRIVAAESRGRRFSLAARYLLGVALAFGLASFFYLPFLVFMADLPTHIANHYEHAGAYSMPLAGLLALVSPTLLEGGRIFIEPPMTGVVIVYQTLPYVGLAPVLLALFSKPGTTNGRRSLYLFSVWLAVLLTLKLTGVPPMQWLGSLPLFKTIHYVPYFGFLYSVFFAFLAALGFERLAEGNYRLGRICLILFIGSETLLILRMLAEKHGMPASPHAAAWSRDWWLLAALMLALVASLAGRALASHQRTMTAVMLGAVTALVALEGLYNASRYPRQKRVDVWRHPPPYIQWLEREAGHRRVLSLWGPLVPNASAAFGVFGVDSLAAFNPTPMVELYQRYVQPTPQLFLRWGKNLPPEAVLDRLAVELVVVGTTRSDMIQEAGKRDYRQVYGDPFAVIFQRRSTPRFFFSSSYRVVDTAAALEAIAAAPGTREVLVDQGLPFASQPNRPQDQKVEVTAYGVNGFTLRTRAPRRGLVYCAESFFPGWRARVNGRPVEIRRANHAFKAVEVPAGMVVIEFSYWPPGLGPGLAISGLSLLALAVLALRRAPTRLLFDSDFPPQPS
jgi:hypothetical protein